MGRSSHPAPVTVGKPYGHLTKRRTGGNPLTIGHTMQVIPEGVGPVIPEGVGPVKTTAGVCFCLCWSFLVLVGRVEVGVGGQGSGGARPRSGRRALTATPFGACCSGQGDRNCLCCFR